MPEELQTGTESLDASLPGVAAEQFAPEPGGEPSQEETPDYAAMLEAERARSNALEREVEQRRQQEAAWEQQRQQMAFQQAQAAFNAREEQLRQQTQGFDPEMRDQVMGQFYREQLGQMQQAAQQAIQAVAAQSFADRVLRDHGLTPDDRILLGNDPNQMTAIAARIQAERDQHKKLIDQIERDRRARQAQQTIQSGVNLIGGVNARPVVQADYEKGSLDHLRALMAS